MALTRSFLTSYFIIDEKNSEFYKVYSQAITKISENGIMEVHEPTLAERNEMTTKIHITLSKKKKS